MDQHPSRPQLNADSVGVRPRPRPSTAVDGGGDEASRAYEHATIVHERRRFLDTEDDLLAMQDEFLQTQDRPAAKAIRVQRPAVSVVRSAAPPTVGSSDSNTTRLPSSAARNSGDDDDDDDDAVPPPLEKDVVMLGSPDDNNSNQLPDRPPTIEPTVASSRRTTKTGFLPSRSIKPPRSHFPTTGERFEIDLDELPSGSDDEVDNYELEDEFMEPETENQTRDRLEKASVRTATLGSLGAMLSDGVREKPTGDVVAPTAPTTAFGSMTQPPSASSRLGGVKATKGKSLFAQRLAVAQGKASGASVDTSSLETDVANPSTPTPTTSQSQRIPQSIASPVAQEPSLVNLAVKQRPSSLDRKDPSRPPRPAGMPPSALRKPTSESQQSTLLQQIDEENRQKLASMSAEEIQRAQEELMQALSPELIKKLRERGSVAGTHIDTVGASSADASSSSSGGDPSSNRNSIQRRVSFSEGVKIEDKLVKMEDISSHTSSSSSSFAAKRHEEEEGDHPLALKRKYYATVSAEPEKLEWMGIDDPSLGPKGTTGKALAPGVQPYTATEADPAAAHYRFDFSGKLLDEGQEVPMHLGLHHHGQDPTKPGYTLSELLHLIRSSVPSQRILPLNVISKVLLRCRDPDYAPFDVRAGILRWLIDSLRAPVYLRAALDDKTDSGLVAAMNAISAWACPWVEEPHEHSVWESLDYLDRGYERINLQYNLPQTATKFAGMELKPDSLNTSQEQGTEDEDTIRAHAILASKDPNKGLLAMKVVPRLRYLIDVCRLPAATNLQVLGVLRSLLKHNTDAAQAIYECEGLMQALVKRFIHISWPSDAPAAELRCTRWTIEILDQIVRSSKAYAVSMVDAGVLEPLLRFVVLSPEAKIEQVESITIQTSVMKLYRSLAAYGLYCNVLGDSLQTILLRDIAQTIQDRATATTTTKEKEKEEEGVTILVQSALTRKLTMFFQLLTVWTHAAGDAHRTTPEHVLHWAQPTAFLDVALQAYEQFGQAVLRPPVKGSVDSWELREDVMLVASVTRFLSTWSRYLPTNPPEDVAILDRLWSTLNVPAWGKSKMLVAVHTRLVELVAAGAPEHLEDHRVPHTPVSLNNPLSLRSIGQGLLDMSIGSEYLSAHLTTMYYLARLTNSPARILPETVAVLVSGNIVELVESLTSHQLAIQDKIPVTLPPWMAFISRHAVYFIWHWLRSMDNLLFHQDPSNSSHTKLTLFPLFQATALSLLQVVLPGDEAIGHGVLHNIVFHERVLNKLLSQNTQQVAVVKRVLEPMYHQCFIKSERDLERSQALTSSNGKGVKSMVLDYSSISAQPLFSWLFYPIDILYRSKLTYVEEESGAMIAATSVAHCALDFVYSLLQTLDGISFELIYMAVLKLLTLEGEMEPERTAEDDFVKEDGRGGAHGGNSNTDGEEEEEEEEEEDGFIDHEVNMTINRLLDHFSTKGDSGLVRHEDDKVNPVSEAILSTLCAPLPFYQFMKNFMDNVFTTGTVLQYQATAARLIFPAMAISKEYQLLIWSEGYNSLSAVTTCWDAVDPGSLLTLLESTGADTHPGSGSPHTVVDSEVVSHYLKAVVSGRVIKQRNPALYWIAVHHLARVAFGPLQIRAPGPPRLKFKSRGGGGQSSSATETTMTEQAQDQQQQQQQQTKATGTSQDLERESIARAIVMSSKSEEAVRDWFQYDQRNYAALLPDAETGQVTHRAMSHRQGSISSLTAFSPMSPSFSANSLAPSRGQDGRRPSSLGTSGGAEESTGGGGGGAGVPRSVSLGSTTTTTTTTTTSRGSSGGGSVAEHGSLSVPPECFLERRSLYLESRMEWIVGLLGQEGHDRLENAIAAAGGWLPGSQPSGGVGGAGPAHFGGGGGGSGGNHYGHSRAGSSGYVQYHQHHHQYHRQPLHPSHHQGRY
ncbi:RNA polymerase II associated protein 1 [Actinomortierella ambigua]|nr:RNA polymerase II associated protein 1 [Actinomortierella ambigua]